MFKLFAEYDSIIYIVLIGISIFIKFVPFFTISKKIKIKINENSSESYEKTDGNKIVWILQILVYAIIFVYTIGMLYYEMEKVSLIPDKSMHIGINLILYFIFIIILLFINVFTKYEGSKEEYINGQKHWYIKYFMFDLFLMCVKIATEYHFEKYVENNKI